MPRRNLLLLFSVALISLVCYHRVERNLYGRVLGGVIGQIQQLALEPVENPELFDAAMQGMIGRLDEHSAYIRPAIKEKFYELIDLQFCGVGMEIGVDAKTKQLTVVCPLVNSPAFAAGIQAGDRILRIDDAGTQGMSLRDAVGLLRGKQGSAVTLTVLHEGESSPVEIQIVRAMIQEDTVLGDTRNADGSWNYFLDEHDRIAYLRIISFADKTVEDFDRAMQWLIDHKMRGLVLDLRDDPGGLLDSAVAICNRLIRSGTIVTIRDRFGRVNRASEADGSGTWLDFPIAILVDRQTASAAEIVAACLQDHQRAVVVGERTYGKGTVQQLIDLESGCGAMKLTTASYWRPSGNNIHRLRSAKETDQWGVKPNEGFEIALVDDDLDKLRQRRMERDAYKPNGSPKPSSDAFADLQLARAVEHVEHEAAK